MSRWPRYAARPYVCGAIGRVSPDLVERLRAAGPPVEPLLAEPDAVLMSSTPLAAYAPGAYAWGQDRPTGQGRPTGRPRVAAPWLSVAEAFETPGLIADADSVTLHSGAFGLVDVFHVTIGNAVYFAERIAPLLGLLGGPLTVDWAAWAAILRLTCPLDSSTPYAEVRRLPGGTALVWSRTARRVSMDRRAPRWVRNEPAGDGVTAGDMVELLRNVFERHTGESLLIPISGGYDSRLLAAVALSAGLPVESWTTSPDDGQDVDIAYGRMLARELGVPHRVIMPTADTWPLDASFVAKRLEYQTPHHVWIARFTSELHDDGRAVVDGLAGGPLMKNFLIRGDALAASSPGERRAALLRALSIGDPDRPILSPPAAAWITSSVTGQFSSAVSGLAGHRSELPLSVLHTRTARGISRSPIALIGPENRVIVPFMDPDFFDAALSVSVNRKDGGRFYREILRAAHPRVAAMPSTNERLPNHRVPPRSTGPAAREWTHDRLRRAASIPGLLSAEMIEMLDRGPDALATLKSWNPRFWIHGLAVFGAWLDEFEERLSDLTPPWAE